MGFWSEFQIFCLENDLDPRKKSSLIAYETGYIPEPPTPCPSCGRGMQRGHCHYCGYGKEAPKSPEERAASEAYALDLWNAAAPIGRTLAARYLADHRKIIMLPPNTDNVLRFHACCPFGHKQTTPALLALLRDVRDDRPCGVQRIPLDPATATKTEDPRTLGTLKGAAMKLWPGPVDGRLTIGEGVETVLSAAQMWPEVVIPAWAVGPARNIGEFPILNEIKELSILVDNDPPANGRKGYKGRQGQRNAKQCGDRYAAWAVRVNYYKPTRHKDFNDILQEQRNARKD